MVITRWFVLLMATGVIPVYFSDGSLLYYWIGGVIALGLIDLLLAPSPRPLQVQRRLPLKLRLDEHARVELFLTNRSNRSMNLLVRDAWQPTAGLSPSRQRLILPSHERRKLLWRLTPTRRGILTSNFVTVRSFGPLRLAARQITINSEGSVKVLPAFRARKHLPSRIAKLREIDGQSQVMIRGQGTEFDSLRDYVRGDDVRSIDWRSTARRQEVTVRTWRPERDRKVILVVDTGRTSAARIQDETRLDTYFETALLLAALTSQAGDNTQIFGFDRRLRFRVAGMTGPEQLSKMMDSLSTVEPELIETDWTTVPAEIGRLTTGKSLVVIFTTADSIGATRNLIGILPQISSKHTVVIASIEDPELKSATKNRESVDDIYLAAASEKALLDQQRLDNAFARLGADVIRATPNKLPPVVADHYLKLKALGRL